MCQAVLMSKKLSNKLVELLMVEEEMAVDRVVVIYSQPSVLIESRCPLPARIRLTNTCSLFCSCGINKKMCCLLCIIATTNYYKEVLD